MRESFWEILFRTAIGTMAFYLTLSLLTRDFANWQSPTGFFVGVGLCSFLLNLRYKKPEKNL